MYLPDDCRKTWNLKLQKLCVVVNSFNLCNSLCCFVLSTLLYHWYHHIVEKLKAMNYWSRVLEMNDFGKPWVRGIVVSNVGCESCNPKFNSHRWPSDYGCWPWASQQLLFHSSCSFAIMGSHSLLQTNDDLKKTQQKIHGPTDRPTLIAYLGWKRNILPMPAKNQKISKTPILYLNYHAVFTALWSLHPSTPTHPAFDPGFFIYFWQNEGALKSKYRAREVVETKTRLKIFHRKIITSVL